jgi:hypothetical protein
MESTHRKSADPFSRLIINYANCTFTWEEESINAVFLLVAPSSKFCPYHLLTAGLVARIENPRYILMLSVCYPRECGTAAYKPHIFFLYKF